jgi:sporulation protein YtfJ
MGDSNLNKLIEIALTNLKTMAEANTVIGKPLEVTGGTTVIPVSKVSLGFTSGGIDYTSKNSPDKTPNFGGGTGTGYTVMPVAFLVVDSNGNVRLLNITESADSGSDLIGTIAGLAEKAPSIIERIMQIFKKDKPVTEVKSNGKAGDSVILENADMNNPNFINGAETE